MREGSTESARAAARRKRPCRASAPRCARRCRLGATWRCSRSASWPRQQRLPSMPRAATRRASLGCFWGVCSGRSGSEVDPWVAHCRPEARSVGRSFDREMASKDGVARRLLVFRLRSLQRCGFERLWRSSARTRRDRSAKVGAGKTSLVVQVRSRSLSAESRPMFRDVQAPDSASA